MKKKYICLVLTLFAVLCTSCEFGAVHTKDLTNSIDFSMMPRQLKYQEQLFLSKPSSKIEKNNDAREVVRLIDYPTFMDATGFFTTIKQCPKRVAVLSSSYAQVWQLAGGKVSITIKESLDRNFLNDTKVAVVGSGNGKDINLESLLAYEPDLVVLTAEYASHVELAEVLRLYEIPTLVLRVDSFFDYLKMLSIFTQILGTKSCYQQYGNEVLDKIDSILEITDMIEKKPNILFLRAFSYGVKVKTNNHFVGQMLKELGATNIADKADITLDTLSQETLMTSDVDHIFISVMGDDEEAVKRYVEDELFKLPGYQAMEAVKNHQYTILPKDLFSYKPNQNWDQAYKYLAEILYPEYFKN